MPLSTTPPLSHQTKSINPSSHHSRYQRKLFLNPSRQYGCQTYCGDCCAYSRKTMHSQLYVCDSFNRHEDHDVKAQQQHKYNKDDILSEEQTRKLCHGCNTILGTLNVEVCALTLANTIIDSLSRALSTNTQPNPLSKRLRTLSLMGSRSVAKLADRTQLSVSLWKNAV